MTKIKIEICPVCQSDDIQLHMGGTLGMLYKCGKCNYVGPIILEKEIDKEQQ